MKHLKYFESIKNIPQIGDYVICEEPLQWNSSPELINFISNNIGILKAYDVTTNTTKEIYIIQYDNIPDNLSDDFNYNYFDCRGYYIEDIKHFSNNKKDLEVFIQADKFNL